MAFNGSDYVAHVAKRLLAEFAFSADAGTPVLVGSAKEHPARKQLESLMPDGIGVGSGLIIDSFGSVSKQQDIVVYEKISPVFSINGSPDATFYPVEGVIAAGEVKSSLGKPQLKDTFEKSASVKKLKRYAVPPAGLGQSSTISFRSYGSTQMINGVAAEQYDQEKNSLDQIFYFVLCEKFSSSAEATLENYSEYCQDYGKQLAPNLISSLTDGLIAPRSSTLNLMTLSPIEADHAIFSPIGSASFETLLLYLRRFVTSGRTVSRSHYDRYFLKDGASSNIPVSITVGI